MSRRRLTTLLAGVASLALCLFHAPQALAQDGDDPQPPSADDVVNHCVDTLADITARATGAIASLADAGADAIVALDENGAPPPAIISAHRRAATAVNNTARRAHQTIDAVTRRCAGVLNRLDAPEDAFQTIRMASHRAHDAIRDTAHQARVFLGETLARALADERPDDDNSDAEPQPQPEPADVGADVAIAA